MFGGLGVVLSGNQYQRVYAVSYLRISVPTVSYEFPKY